MGARVAGKKMAKHQVHNAPHPSNHDSPLMSDFLSNDIFPSFWTFRFFFFLKRRCWFTFVIQNVTDGMNQIGAQCSVSAAAGCV